MKLSITRSALRFGRPKGFILVAVLLLIALVTILVVVTSLLARVERNAVASETNTELARQNALFGLDVALAQLQKTAGPDQVITARADILDSNPATVAVEGFPAATAALPNNPGQAYWTGVWPTGSAPPDAYYAAALPTPSSSLTPQRTTSLGNSSPSTTQTTTAQKVKQAAWLVSDPIDPTTNQPAKLDPTAALAADPTATPAPGKFKMVALAKNLPDLTGGTTNVSVCAPLVSIFPSAAAASPTATPSGKYAYWVSDEGVKAKPNLIDPTYVGAASNGNSAFVQSQLHFVGPQAVATQDGLFGANANDLRDPKYATDIPKVSTLQSLGYVQGAAPTPAVTGVSGSGAAKYSPDVTTFSYGVLADVRNGGLKTDLSQLFEDPTNQFSAFLNSLATIHTADPAADQKVWEIIEPSYDAYNHMNPSEFGVRWQSLYNYYSLYKNTVMYPSGCPWSDLNSYSSGNPGTSSPKIDERIFNYTSNPNGAIPPTPSAQVGEYYMPHLVGAGIYFAMTSVQGPPTGATSHTYSLIMYAEPRVVLYNPYNVTLTAANTKPYTVNMNSNIFSRKWSVAVSGTLVQDEVFGWANGNGGTLALQFDPAANFVLQPGELRVYGLGTSAQSAAGFLTQFDGQAHTPPGAGAIKITSQILGNKVGQAQWQYVGDDGATLTPPRWPSPSSTTMWQASVADTADVTVSFDKNQAFFSNNGYYKVAVNPGVWPNGSLGDSTIGRLFSSPPSENASAAEVADLGPILGMAAAAGNYSAGKPFGYFVLRAKGVVQGQSSKFGPMPGFSSADGEFSPLPTFFDNPNQDIDFSLATQNPVGSLTDMEITGSGTTYNTFWGTQDVARSPNDPTQLVLRDVPRQPMVSLGQFMHMAMHTSMNVSTNAADTNSCMMAVGGSLADPYTPPSPSTAGPVEVVDNNIGRGPANFDDNFLMNQGLFDSYYFSTVPLPKASPDSSHPAMDASYQAVLPTMTGSKTSLTDANIQSGTCVLPNARMRFYAKNGIPPQASKPTAANYVPNYQKAAANLLLSGAFNVNSTSVPAWRALLSSLSGNVPMGGLYAGPTTFTSSQYPIFRFLSPFPVNTAGSGGTTSSAVTTLTAPNPWASINILTDTTNAASPTAGGTQVTDLATAIVKQVKRLGPFLSMADFLNHRLTSATDSYGPGNTTAYIGLRGALQAAIDDTTINAGILAMGTATSNITTGGRGNQPYVMANSALLPTNTAIGVPGCLMQQDLVQCFSPVMTVRSDTFLVRCYGEADNVKSGATQGRAWGEAIVQRLPDFVDQTDPALTAGGSLGDATQLAKVSAINQTFGRRFKVVSFRWLNETDL